MKKNEVFKFDNYLFDLYGTLIDIRTDEWDLATWHRWCAYLDRRGIKHPEVEAFRDEFFAKDKEYRAKPTPFAVPEIEILEVYDELFRKYGNPPIDPDELFEISYQFRVSSLIYSKLFEGVPEFLAKLHEMGKKVFILSNAQRSYTLPEIQHFELDKMVDDYLISSDFRVMKPDKAFYDEMVKKHNLDRSKTVMLGDSKENDYQGAINAGLNGIWLNGENAADKFYVNCLK